MNRDIMKALGFDKEVERFEVNECIRCKDIINFSSFRNEISKKECQISGLCQKCQDEIFGKD